MYRTLLVVLLGCLLSVQLATGASLLPTEKPPAHPEPVVQGGLLGAIADSLDDIPQTLNIDNHWLDTWRLRADRAANEVDELVSQHSGPSTLELLTDFALLTIAWLIAFALLTYFGRLASRACSKSRQLRDRPRPRRVVKYLLAYTLPALISLPVTLYISHFMVLSAGRVLGLSLAYATSAGIFSTSIIFCLIALFDAGHKRPAVRIIRRIAPRPLFLIGFLAAWSDALTSPQIARQLGGNITSSIAALTGLLATLAFAALVLKLRRPVAHLIRNRELKERLQHRALQETLRIFSSIWYLPILLMIMVSAIHLIGAAEESQRALQKALLTSILLIGTVFISTVLHHTFKHRVLEGSRVRLRPYKELLRNLAYALLRIALAVIFIELLGRIWGFSVLDFALRNSLGRKISDSLSSIGLILLVTWLLWVVIDTAIQEAIKPTIGRRSTRQPSTRIRTILPMLRNAIKIILVVICTITTMANLGINVSPFLAGAGVIGLAIGFGSQQLVQDVITGLFIIIEDTIAIGDWVVLDTGHAGTVESLTIRTLRLRDSKGFVHSVPFGQIKAVTNQSRQFAYAFFSVQFSYQTNVDSALKLIHEVGQSISEDPLLRHSLKGPLQVFGVDSMNLNGITLTAQFRTSSGSQYAINRAFNERLKKRVDQTEDVSFAQYNPPPARLAEGPA